MILLVDKIEKSFGARVLFSGASFQINPGERFALVGPNGAGKTTMLKIIMGIDSPDAGQVQYAKDCQVGYLEQETNLEQKNTTILAEVMAAAKEIRRMGERANELQAQITELSEQGKDVDALLNEYGQVQDRFEHLGGYELESNARKILSGLGFKVTDFERPCSEFSGGWQMRIALAKLFLRHPDLLLLDEPTNHLDLDALVWLEAWLKRYPGTMIVISHDREFLDGVTSVTFELASGKITRYGGNYSKYEELRAQQLELQQAAFDKQQDKIAHLQKFIDRFKAKATKAKQAQSRMKQIERMEKVAPVLADAEFTFEFKEPANLPNPMLAITDASFGYTDDAGNETVILRGVNRSVLAGQRIGILGANGQGKSTLVKTIARTMPALGGKVTEGKGLNIGYFAQQELDVLRPDEDPLQHMTRLAKDLGADAPAASREQDLRNWLGTFNFTGDMVKQQVGSMSGGEKARLVLAMIVWQRPNLLLLDEPTNHLDLATREALAMAINDFDGTVMLVSHDRHLLRAVCEDFWMVGRGVVGPFDGDLDDYQRYLLDESKRLREEAKHAELPADAPAQDAAAPQMDQREARRLAAQARQQLAEKTKPLKKELEQVDKKMAALSAEKTQLEEKLSTQIPPAEIAEAGKRLKAAGDELDTLEERWLELSEEIEQLTQQAGLGA